ncbi:MAG TPA: HD domain-containing phosphohydrolase [Longimicrobiales bacterium]|nr:HD domain-containing phosphohydrolase [Longimicrobiales bacterium]
MNSPVELSVLKDGADVALDALISAARRAELAGEWNDAERGYTEALRRIQAGEQPERGPEILRWLGRVHFERGEYEQAGIAFESSLVAAQRLNMRKECASALNAMAVVAQFRGTLDVAEALYERSGIIAEEVSADRLSAMIDMNLGTLASVRGDVGTSLMRYQSAHDRFRKMNDARGAGLVLNNMAILHSEVGEWAAAELSFNASYQLAERESDHATMGKIECGRADLYLKRQQFERARECCERAFRTFTRLGSDSGLGAVHRYYGILYRETSKAQMAHVHFSLALKLARTCDSLLLEAETESERAKLYLSERQHRHALRSLNQAHKLYMELDARREILDLRRRLDRMQDVYLQALEMWNHDGPNDDDRGPRRGRRVAEYALKLADALEYKGTDWLKIGAHMHDIGNSGLPQDVLQKPGPLTAEEWQLVQQHTLLGSELVNELEFPIEVRPMIRNHHEHFDGTGYPDALRGDEIPMAARILCIADAFDALTSDRSYRPAFSTEQALHIMQSEAGRVFDPNMFEVFKRLMEPPQPAAADDDTWSMADGFRAAM